jgi:POT family proton-dependent oligopeptide transporter
VSESSSPAQPSSRGFLGQPPGFSTLFFTEMWERFSYYGMRALLMLFLVDQVSTGGMGLDDRTATAIYGLYTAAAYIMAMPGGWLADRLIGAQRAVLWGGVFITLGHLLLAAAGASSSTIFMAGLAVIVVGTGLLKPNISAMVGQLHEQNGGSRDATFTWFYMAINIGALLGPLITAWLASVYGWHVGFLAAAVGMAGGLVYFLATRGRLRSTGLAPTGFPPATTARYLKAVWIAIALLIIVAVLLMTGTVSLSPRALRRHAVLVLALATVGYFFYLLFFAGLNAAEKRSVMVLLVLVLASTLFWTGYEQAGSSLSLFAERNTNRMIESFEFPAGWFQSVPALFVLLCAPLLAALWSFLAARGRDLSVIVKFALGLVGMSLGFLVMAGAALVSGQSLMGATGGAGPIWLITTYLLHTFGELALSPVGMSATSQLVPKRFAGQAMGMWFMSLGIGSLLASQFAGKLGDGSKDISASFVTMFQYGAAGAVLLFIAAPWLRRWATPRP